MLSAHRSVSLREEKGQMGDDMVVGFCVGFLLPDLLTGSFSAHEVEPSTWSSRTKDEES